jgi:PAS domain S-box-containing protein
MVAIMAFVQYGFNAWLAAVHSAFKTNQTVWYTWSNGFLWTSITYFAGASAAAIIAKLFGGVGIYAFIVVTPIIAVVYFTYRTYLKSVEVSQTQTDLAHRHIEELSHHISEQERISRALKESEEHFRNAFDHAAGMALVGPDGRWLQVNQSLCEMLGYKDEEFLGTFFQDITHPEDLGDELVHIHQLLGGKITTSQLEKRFVHKQGHEVWALASASVVNDVDDNPQHLIFQIQDITERKKAEAHIRHAAFHDVLTNLPNRILLTDRLSVAVERAKRNHDYQFAVLFIDLDRFKLVNDSLRTPR